MAILKGTYKNANLSNRCSDNGLQVGIYRFWIIDSFGVKSPASHPTERSALS